MGFKYYLKYKKDDVLRCLKASCLFTKWVNFNSKPLPGISGATKLW